MSDFFVHESSIVDDDVEIGSGTKIWCFSHVQSGARIGTECIVGQNVNIGRNVHIGNNVKIQNNVSVYTGVTIEDDVFCGPSVVFTNVHFPRSHNPIPEECYEKTEVCKGASIGANCTILSGVRVGKYCLVGAGAVVTNDVKDFSIVMGVPARSVGWVCECGKKLDTTLRCSACMTQYKLVNGDNLIYDG